MVYAIDGGTSGYFAYHLPQFFKDAWTTLSTGAH
jgi:hypothetical protein